MDKKDWIIIDDLLSNEEAERLWILNNNDIPEAVKQLRFASQVVTTKQEIANQKAKANPIHPRQLTIQGRPGHLHCKHLMLQIAAICQVWSQI